MMFLVAILMFLLVGALNFLVTLALVGWVIIPSVHAVFDVALPYWGTVGIWFSLITLFGKAPEITKREER
jgi:hypothetical protein